MIVEAGLNPVLRDLLADLGQQLSLISEVVRRKRLTLRPRADHLQVLATGFLQVLGILDMQIDDRLALGRVERRVAAGERHKLELVLRQQVAQRVRIGKFLDDIGSKLNARIPERGNIVDRLRIVAAPGNCGIPDLDVARAMMKWRIEVRQIHGGIEQRPS